MSLAVGAVVQYNEGIAIVYATYPDSNHLGLKFLNKQLQVETEKVTKTSVTLAITTNNTYNVIDNIQTKDDVYFRQALLKLNNIAEGGRSRRRKSRRHKKTNHRRRKSNRRKSRRYKK